jgi:hypothetical protein
VLPLNRPNALTLARILLVPVVVVAVTVLSGADYFLNFRRKLEEASRGAETSQA